MVYHQMCHTLLSFSRSVGLWLSLWPLAVVDSVFLASKRYTHVSTLEVRSAQFEPQSNTSVHVPCCERQLGNHTAGSMGLQSQEARSYHQNNRCDASAVQPSYSKPSTCAQWPSAALRDHTQAPPCIAHQPTTLLLQRFAAQSRRNTSCALIGKLLVGIRKTAGQQRSGAWLILHAARVDDLSLNQLLSTSTLLLQHRCAPRSPVGASITGRYTMTSSLVSSRLLS